MAEAQRLPLGISGSMSQLQPREGILRGVPTRSGREVLASGNDPLQPGDWEDSELETTDPTGIPDWKRKEPCQNQPTKPKSKRGKNSLPSTKDSANKPEK